MTAPTTAPCRRCGERTVCIKHAAALMGVSGECLYAAARRGDALAPGVEFIRLGPRRLLVPRVGLERLLGLEAE